MTARIVRVNPATIQNALLQYGFGTEFIEATQVDTATNTVDDNALHTEDAMMSQESLQHVLDTIEHEAELARMGLIDEASDDAQDSDADEGTHLSEDDNNEH